MKKTAVNLANSHEETNVQYMDSDTKRTEPASDQSNSEENKQRKQTTDMTADSEKNIEESTQKVSGDLASQVVGTWFDMNEDVPMFTFYEDGTGEYASKTKFSWELDDEQTLTITYDNSSDTLDMYNVRRVNEKLLVNYDTDSDFQTVTYYPHANYHFYVDGEFDYSEDKVWILGGKWLSPYWVCVDKSGKALFRIPSDQIKSLGSFSNDRVYVEGEDYAAILDDNGDVVGKFPINDHNFVLAYGGGYILTEEFVADFNMSGYIVRLCDYTGHIVAQSSRKIDGIENDYQIDDNRVSQAYYCGNGIFSVKYREGAEFLTSGGEVWDNLEEDFNINLSFSDGLAVQSFDHQTGILKIMNTEGKLLKYEISGADIDHSSNIVLCEGVIAYRCESKNTLALYNMETGRIFELKQYTDQIYWDMLPDVLRFCNGRITIPFQGEDGKMYVGAFDEEWNTVIEPVRAEHYYGFSGGYLIVNDGTNTDIYDTSGQKVYSEYAGAQEYHSFMDGVTRLTQYQVGNILYYNDPVFTFMDSEGNILYDEIDITEVVDKSISGSPFVVYEEMDDSEKSLLFEETALARQGGTQDVSIQLGDSVTQENAQSEVPEQKRQDVQNDEQEDKIHNYEIIMESCTWEEAYQACRDRGGNLVRINTKEEYDYIIDMLDNRDYRDYRFYIGGRRDIGKQEYQWVDNSNTLFGNKLNEPEAWCSTNWMTGEPSMKDQTLGIEEHVMELFYYKDEGRWVWNDVPNNLPDYIESANKKICYILEYENN